MADRKIRGKDCVRLSNKIIERCHLEVPAVQSVEDIRSGLFTSLLQVLCGQLPPGIVAEPSTTEDEIANVQTVVDHLANDLISVDLSHISGADVIGGDPRAIYNLLEIFCGLHKYLSSSDKWNLEESLTETEEELSSGSSNEQMQSAAPNQDTSGTEDPTQPSETDEAPPPGSPTEQDSGSAAAVGTPTTTSSTTSPPVPIGSRHLEFVDDTTTSLDETTADEADQDQPEEPLPAAEDISLELSTEMKQLQSEQAEQAPVAVSDETSVDDVPSKDAKSTDDTPSIVETARGTTSPSMAPSGDRAPPPPPRPPHSASLASQGSGAGRGRGRPPPGERSSASDSAVNRRTDARPVGRNVETIKEIHESGGERYVSKTTREQDGNKLQRETVERTVRRKVHSAPNPTRRCSGYSRQSRRPAGGSSYTDYESLERNSCLKVQGHETDVFEFLRNEFPYSHVTDETKRKLMHEYRQQMKYIMSLVQPTETLIYKLRRSDVVRRQNLLTDVVRRQRAHEKRLRRVQEEKQCEIRRRNSLRDQKIACLRAQRYVDTFKQKFESRMAHNKSQEELLMKEVFEDMLDIQRRRLRIVRRDEKRVIKEHYGDNGFLDLSRMHQFFEANARDLSDMLIKERNDLKLADKERFRLADRIKREFRDYMERDVRELNEKVANCWQPQYRVLDADKVRSDLYQAKWKFCVT